MSGVSKILLTIDDGDMIVAKRFGYLREELFEPIWLGHRRMRAAWESGEPSCKFAPKAAPASGRMEIEDLPVPDCCCA